MTTTERGAGVDVRLPPVPVRRAVLAPAIVALTVVVLTFLPLIVLVAAFAVRWLPGRWRGLRLLWFLLVYLVRESVGPGGDVRAVAAERLRLAAALRPDAAGARGARGVVPAGPDRVRPSGCWACGSPPTPCPRSWPSRIPSGPGPRRRPPGARVQPARRGRGLLPAGRAAGGHLRAPPPDRAQGPAAVRPVRRHRAQPAAQPLHPARTRPPGAARRLHRRARRRASRPTGR